jgi:hypothetical protein
MLLHTLLIISESLQQNDGRDVTLEHYDFAVQYIRGFRAVNAMVVNVCIEPMRMRFPAVC